jgi:subtilisin family serine protease
LKIEQATNGGESRVRALVLAAVAAFALAAPATAQAVSPAQLRELVRAREDSARLATASSAATAPLEVPASERRAGLRALAARERPARVVIGLRSPAAVEEVTELAREHGTRVVPMPGLAAVALTADSPPELVEAVGGRSDVAYVEPTVRRSWSSHDPNFDHGIGLPFAWAFGVGPGYVGVNAGPALDGAGGRSDFPVAVLDSGVDRTHPALSVSNYFNAVRFDPEAGSDQVGHGTFVAGLVGARNGRRGLRGTAGETDLIGVKVGTQAGLDSADIARGIDWASGAGGARVINLSLGGPQLSTTERRALDNAFQRNALIVAAAGNDGDNGNPVDYPAAYVGGERGSPGIGLSVAATRPNGSHPSFSTHNNAVSVAAPGATADESDCAHGVYSTLPNNSTLFWDPNPANPSPCSIRFDDPGGRYAYSEGTSMSSPLVAGVASVVWMANRDLEPDQVADVIGRSARQTVGTGWNRFTGHGVADANAAFGRAGTYDTLEPTSTMRARRRGRKRNRVLVTASGTDRTEPGDELAGDVDVELYTSRNGRNFTQYAGPVDDRIRRTIGLSARRRLWIQALICDANLNCAVRERGPFRARR